MCSLLGIPSAGSAVSLRVSFVDVHPDVPLVRLWGLAGERRDEYAALQRELQTQAGPRLAAEPGGTAAGGALGPGELCLVELGGRWQRCRVVSRQARGAPAYRVFLLDEGRSVCAAAHHLARGRPELFQLPSEVLGCVLADLVPPGGAEPTGTAWPLGAADFLSCLQGKEVSGQVREVLLPQRLVVLELPWLLAQMQHLGLAQQAAPSAFRTLLQCCLAPVSAPVAQPTLLPPAAPADYFYPRLQPGVTEPVLVTQVLDPQRIYCQLRSLSQEIRRLSDTMRQLYEAAVGRGQEQEVPPKPGSPCAARGIDGHWYRALLLETFAGELGRPLAQVMCVDYGRKEFVTGANLRHLPPECFRMPVLTYPCALQGVSDGGCGWSRSQLSELKVLLLGKAVSARIDAYSSFEHLYYVSLYGDNGINLNCLYGVQAHCLSASLLQGGSELPDAAAEEPEQPPGAPPATAAVQRAPAHATRLPITRLKAGAFCKGQVSFARDPGEFWLRLQEHKQPLGQLMRSMSDFYSRAQKLEAVLLEPQLGSLCCAKWKEKAYYRALVTRVLGKGVEVHLVDRGNTETLDWYEVKELLPQFMELPAVALKCCLADASPLGESWSKECVSYFKRAVRNKELTFHVLGTQGDKYVVEILDQSQAGEKNVCKIMTWGGYARFHGAEVPQVRKAPAERLGQDPKWGAEEGKQASATDKRIEIEPKPKIERTVLNSSATLVKDQPTVSADDLSDTVSDKEKMPPNLPCSFAQNYLEIKPGLPPYEDQLEVGSTVDVVVSCVENPGYFWCQLRRNSQELKKLMATIQDYCKDSAQPHYLPNPVCLAKYSEDKKWYRALILSGILPKKEVEVIYVDYGNKDVVSLKNLCSINADFLKLKAQAFRCSLYNLIQPNGPDPLVWDEEAISAFQEFVDASMECLQLNCTIFALAAVNNKELFNIVDLITPFESVCHFLIERGLARPVQPQSPLASSVQLYSYYYSTHDIKIGSEEEIYVTHVDDPQKFYIQLQRSADALEQLTDNIDHLNKVLLCLKMSQGSGNLCLARYTDSHWYRGIVTKTKPNKEVYFVDFGNTEVVKKEDILPIPNDAYNILLLPMQAIKCSLSDISNVSEEATEWFTKAVLDKHLKAIIVAKESDGKLMIELYDGNIQINAKMKQDFSLLNSRANHRHPENETLHSKNQDTKEGRNENVKSFTTSTNKFTERENWRSEMQRGESSCKTSFICKAEKLLPSSKKESLSDPWKGSVDRFNNNKASPLDKVKESPLPIRKEDMGSVAVISGTAGNRDQGENSVYIPLKNLSDLHQKNLLPGLKTSVYISHVNNLSDFYIQLASDESQLNSISETLNNRTRGENLCKQQLKTGDLIGAAYSEDGLWYRAVIKEKSSEELISVQYIDYGNTSVVNISETCKVPEEITLIPVMSIHCLLGGLQAVNCLDWTRKAVLYFSERTSDVQINCEFVEKVKDKWEVLLSDDQGMMAVDLIEKFAAREGFQLSEMCDRDESRYDIPNNVPDLSSDEQNKISHLNDTETFSWKIPEVGQTVEAYVTMVKGPGFFWCQIAGTESINYLEEKLKIAGELSANSTDDFRSSIKRGTICIVKSSEDEEFYRAEIRSIKGTSLIVRHVDYGTEEVVDREVVRQVPDELLAVPNQAFPCCLSGFDSSEGSWISEITDKFHDMIAESLLGITIIEIKKDNPSGIPLCSVKMQCNGVSINEELSCFWKPNLRNHDKTSANIENTSEGKNGSTGIGDKDSFALEEASSAAWTQVVQNENQSAILDPELFHPTESDCLHAPETPFPLEEVEVVLPTSNGEHQVKHQISFETFGTDSALLESESNSKIFLEPEIADVQVLFSSETKDLKHELSKMEVLDNVSQTEMLELTVDGQSLSDTSEELLKLQSQYVQPSLGEEMKNLMELDDFQTSSSYDEIRDLLLELSWLEMQSSLDERTKEMLELEFLDEQILGDETRDLVTQKSLEISPSLEERENLLELKSLEMQPSFGDDREETLEPLPSNVQFSLVDEMERLKLDVDMLQVHQIRSLAEEVLEMKSPQIPLLLDEAGKQLEVGTHQAEIVLHGTMKEPVELVPSEVLASLGDEAKDVVLELEESVLQLSASSIVQLSALKTDVKQGAVYSVGLCNVGLLDTKHEECAEQLSVQETSSAEEQMKQGCHKAFKEYGNPYASGEPLDEETEIEKQDDSSADCGAEQRACGACSLEGFAVGSKCVVWTSPKWCEAQILEVTDEGTRVLNLSNGNEEIVNPENVWNGIPELARSPSEKPTDAADNLHPLSLDVSVFQEKGTCYDSDVTNPCRAANIPEKASE